MSKPFTFFPRRHALLAAGIFVLAYLQCAGDTLLFDNGDRLSGRFVSERDGYILFETASLGMIRVAEESATVLLDKPNEKKTSDEVVGPEPSMRERVQALAELKGLDREEAEDLAVEIETAVKENPDLLEAAFKQLVADNRVLQFINRYNPLRNWDSRLEFGYSVTSADNTVENFRFHYQSEYSPQDMKSQHRLTASYLYGTQTDAAGNEFKNQDRLVGQYRYRHDLSKRLFFQNSAQYLRDAKSGIEHELNDNVGIGYTLVRSQRMRLTVTPGGGVQYEERTPDMTQWSFILAFYQDLEFRFNDRMRLQQESDFRMNADDTEDYTYFVAAFLEHKLNDYLDVNLRYSYTHNNVVPVGSSRVQDSLTVNLALSF